MAGPAFAGGDRITMKDGTVYAGDILFHNDDSYYISTASGIQHPLIVDIARIDFGSTSAATAAAAPPPAKIAASH